MNIKRLRIILAASFGGLGLLCSILGFTGALNNRTSSKKYADWLGGIEDTTLLRDVSLPGSHDTMALYSIADLAGQCQTLSLNEQLNLGVRFLDIRLKEDHNSLKAVHGFVDQKASFDDINKTVTSFLEKHPKEFIIMSIKEEADPEAAMENYRQGLMRINSRERYERFLNSGFNVIFRDESRSVAETLLLAEKAFELDGAI